MGIWIISEILVWLGLGMPLSHHLGPEFPQTILREFQIILLQNYTSLFIISKYFQNIRPVFGNE